MPVAGRDERPRSSAWARGLAGVVGKWRMAEATHSGRGLWEDRILVGMDGEEAAHRDGSPYLGEDPMQAWEQKQIEREQGSSRFFGRIMLAIFPDRRIRLLAVYNPLTSMVHAGSWQSPQSSPRNILEASVSPLSCHSSHGSATFVNSPPWG